jgi:Flp pilus assembly pilin Flp
MIAILKTMLRDDHGTSMVEYGLLLAYVAIIALAGAQAVGNGTESLGISTAGTSVHGDPARNHGVFGHSIYSYGIDRYASDDLGVVAENHNANHYALLANADASENNSFGASGQGAAVYIDGGNGVFSGSVTAQSFVQGLRTRDGGLVAASVSLTPLATIEDSGTGRLERGQGIVRLDPALARTIDFRSGYQVFLTPDGETRGLYVAAKYERGFIVRETEHGRSSVYFDYRILAHPVGASDVRLPQLNASVTTNGV